MKKNSPKCGTFTVEEGKKTVPSLTGNNGKFSHKVPNGQMLPATTRGE